MPTMTTITANDSAAVTHSFVPAGKLDDGKGTLRYVERLAANPAASPYLTLLQQSAGPGADLSARGMKVPTRIVSLRFGMFGTYVDADTGLTMIDYPLWAAVTFGIPERASSVQADDLQTLLRNILVNSTHIKDSIKVNDRVYG